MKSTPLIRMNSTFCVYKANSKKHPGVYFFKWTDPREHHQPMPELVYIMYFFVLFYGWKVV